MTNGVTARRVFSVTATFAVTLKTHIKLVSPCLKLFVSYTETISFIARNQWFQYMKLLVPLLETAGSAA